MPNNHILVVDDDDDLRGTICSFLSRSGYKTSEANDGYKAIKSIYDEQPILIITDIMMPEKEGIGMIMDIRRDFKDEIKIIAVSGGGQFTSSFVLRSARSLGADAVMAKPFDFDELLHTVETVLQDFPQSDIIQKQP